MSFCVLGAVTVPVAVGSTKESRDLIGSISRAFSGKARYDLRRHKRKWTLKTKPMSSSDYGALLAAIDVSTGTVAMTGDIVGSSTNVYARITVSDVVDARVSGSWVTNLRVAELEIWEA
jgi:hypothetical protein